VNDLLNKVFSFVKNFIEDTIKFTRGVVKLFFSLIKDGLIPSPTCPECKSKIRGSESGKPICKCEENKKENFLL